MALNETRIDVLRGAWKGHVQSALDDVAALSELAKEKDASHLVQVKLLQAQAKLAEQKTTLRSIQCRTSGVHGPNSALEPCTAAASAAPETSLKMPPRC